MSRQKRIRRILVYLLITAVSVCLLFFTSIGHYPTPEIAMCAMEKAQLVGPSKIIASAEVDYGFRDRIILGKTKHGYTLFEYSSNSAYNFGTLSYHKKEEVVTLFSAGIGGMALSMPVYAVCENPRVSSARLTLYATYESQGEVYESTEVTESTYQQNTYFLFLVDVSEVHPYVSDFWRARLNGVRSTTPYMSGYAVIELFNTDGELLETVRLDFPQITK